ncbi:MAG: transcriptional repressor [Deltaproteobacteria bacterium]|nr:MAG: transcriptional repressor [Deltaproteobacteria bacterium]
MLPRRMPQTSIKNPEARLREYLAQRGLKATRQRDLIARVFFESNTHLKVDELLERVRRHDPRVSQATVYRTMRLLKECGLAEERHFGDGQARYEPADAGGEHHDHLICTACGRIVEFVDDRIEALQEKVARDHGFVVTDHKMELYGLCARCQRR